jgi:hypothetical protein
VERATEHKKIDASKGDDLAQLMRDAISSRHAKLPGIDALAGQFGSALRGNFAADGADILQTSASEAADRYATADTIAEASSSHIRKQH